MRLMRLMRLIVIIVIYHAPFSPSVTTAACQPHLVVTGRHYKSSSTVWRASLLVLFVCLSLSLSLSVYHVRAGGEVVSLTVCVMEPLSLMSRDEAPTQIWNVPVV